VLAEEYNNPKITHHIKTTSGRKNPKSTELVVKNTMLAVNRPEISILFELVLSEFKPNLSMVKISQSIEVIPSMPISAQICK
jgi:hypothetical protein